MRRLSLALVVLAGCFTPDLGEGQVVCGTGGECPPGYACRVDGRCYHAFASDGGGGSGGGGGGGDLATHCDRACPPTSMCSAGVCAPPVGAMMCQRPQDCPNSLVCDEYNVGGMTHGYCTPPISGAQGGSADACSAPGYDSSCQTGICAQDNKGRRACLVPCKMDDDCSSGKCQSPVTQPSTIDGAPAGMLKFCTN